MKILKTRNVKTPTRGTQQSAGIDFYIPEDFKAMTLSPNEDLLIPSGIKVKVPRGYALIAFNKSGISVKSKLQVGACVIDEDYQGEVHLHVFNYSNTPIPLFPGQKLVQYLLIRVPYVDIELVNSENELFPNKTERKDGGFGSTNETSSSSVMPILKNITAYLIKQGPQSESFKTHGYYSRHVFRDLFTNKNYILDVSHLCPQFIGINIGDTLTNLVIFENKKTGNTHIDGSSRMVNIGHYKDIIGLMKKEKIKGFDL